MVFLVFGQSKKFWFVNFSIETDRNNWKSSDFGFFRFWSVFGFLFWTIDQRNKTLTLRCYYLAISFNLIKNSIDSVLKKNPKYKKKKRVIKIFKTLTLITYKKQSNRAVEVLNEANQERKGKKERRIIMMIKRSLKPLIKREWEWKKGETSMWRLAVETKSGCGVECGGGGCLRVSESESENWKVWGCEPWGM